MDLNTSHCFTHGGFISRLKYIEFSEASVLQGNVGTISQAFLWMEPLFVLSSENLLSIQEEGTVFIFMSIYHKTILKMISITYRRVFIIFPLKLYILQL